MQITEDRISHLAHLVIERLWRDDLADLVDESLSLQRVKDSISQFFSIAVEIDESVRRKLASYANAKVPGSRDWDILYHKFYQEEMAKRKW